MKGGDTKCVSKEKYQDSQNWADATADVAGVDAVRHFAAFFLPKRNWNA
jgi:hypothetical protein